MVGIRTHQDATTAHRSAFFYPGGRVNATANARAFTTVVDSEAPSGFSAFDGDLRSNLKRPARILIADDHEAVRRGLRSALMGAGWVVCGEASNGSEAISKAMELKPDLVLLDVSMPVMSGIEAAPRILNSAPKVKVVVFTMHESQQVKNEMLNIGVHGLAVKSAPLSNLLETIRNVLGN